MKATSICAEAARLRLIDDWPREEAAAKQVLAVLAGRAASDERAAEFCERHRLFPRPRPAPTLTVFVLAHRRQQFAAIGPAPHLRSVYLHDISFRERRLAESRIFLSDLLFQCQSEYIGLASASWNWKYNGNIVWHGRRWPHCLPVEILHALPLSPRVVWAAAPTTCDGATGFKWSVGLERIFPGILPTTREVVKHFGLRHVYRHSLLANNFVAHRDAVRALTRFMRSAIGWLDGKYGPAWPIKPERTWGAFADRLPAFMCEALSLLWWANQTDLEIRQIPPP